MPYPPDAEEDLPLADGEDDDEDDEEDPLALCSECEAASGAPENPVVSVVSLGLSELELEAEAFEEEDDDGVAWADSSFGTSILLRSSPSSARIAMI